MGSIISFELEISSIVKGIQEALSNFILYISSLSPDSYQDLVLRYGRKPILKHSKLIIENAKKRNYFDRQKFIVYFKPKFKIGCLKQ